MSERRPVLCQNSRSIILHTHDVIEAILTSHMLRALRGDDIETREAEMIHQIADFLSAIHDVIEEDDSNRENNHNLAEQN